MRRFVLLSSTTACCCLGLLAPAFAAPPAASAVVSAPPAATTTAAVPKPAEACLSDVKAFHEQMQKDGYWLGGSDYGYGYPIGGYGFGDPHVNSILKNTLRAKATGSGRPPVLILDHDAAKRPLAMRGADPWGTAMGDTLRASRVSFRDKSHRSEKQWTNLPQEISPDEFEMPIGRNHLVPVAIWSWGFLSASDHVAAMAKWLSGDPSAQL